MTDEEWHRALWQLRYDSSLARRLKTELSRKLDSDLLESLASEINEPTGDGDWTQCYLEDGVVKARNVLISRED
jgi:hypothetical protein